ncbi:CHAT domain-containing protein [Longimicrobium sp.]|jgi:TPR repeat protein|uniref:CHAT domain-containing protein n=1 Tax=Longimicrobium sp. TaxID=2029185 RepID=UPI002ED8C476
MDRIKILFFAADPLSAPSYGNAPRLMLDDDVRRIREKVRSAEYRDSLDFDFRLAARTDDLVQALTEVCPQVVHFSGHGGKQGLVLVSADGRHPRRVDAEGLAELFRAFRGDIRLVVLNACLSIPQARAIADVVGCAIGTRESIPDDAAIAFGSSFYRAIASGSSVQAAFDRANAAMGLEHPEARGCTELVVREDVDAAQLFLIAVPPRPEPAPFPEDRREGDSPPPVAAAGRARALLWAALAAPVLALSGGAGIAAAWREPQPIQRLVPEAAGQVRADPAVTGAVSRRVGGPPDPAPSAVAQEVERANPAATSPGSAEPSSADEALAAGRNLFEVGNHAAAFPLFGRAAQAGHPEAMAFLGMAYLQGQGTARNTDLALVWLRRARDKRNPRGMNALGVAYEQGAGVDRSYRWAMHWYQAAAAKSYAPAMLNIADMHRQGLGRAVNHDSALVWYRRAIDAGSLEAMVDAGMMYDEVLTGQRDTAEALRLYRTAAENGSARGMVAMGRACEKGELVRRDYGQAMNWYRKAAVAGSADAMNNLGVLYQNGLGVARSRTQAIDWFRRAAAAGSTVAQGNLAALRAN